MARAYGVPRPAVTCGSGESRSGPLSHLDEQGAEHIIDGTEKVIIKRTAVAAGALHPSAHVGNADLDQGACPKVVRWLPHG